MERRGEAMGRYHITDMQERMPSMTNDQLTMTNTVDWTLDIGH